ESAAHQRSRARRVTRVQHIDIKRYRIPGSSVSGDRDRLVHAGTKAALVDLAHGKKPYGQFADQLALARIDVAPSNMCANIGFEFWRKAPDVHQFRSSPSEQRRQRHAMNVTRRSCFWRIHLGVRVKVNQSELLLAFAKRFHNPGE